MKPHVTKLIIGIDLQCDVEDSALKGEFFAIELVSVIIAGIVIGNWKSGQQS